MEVTTATARAQVVGRKLFGALRETLSESVWESLPLLCVELLHHSWLILPASPHAMAAEASVCDQLRLHWTCFARPL